MYNIFVYVYIYINDIWYMWCSNMGFYWWIFLGCKKSNFNFHPKGRLQVSFCEGAWLQPIPDAVFMYGGGWWFQTHGLFFVFTPVLLGKSYPIWAYFFKWVVYPHQLYSGWFTWFWWTIGHKFTRWNGCRSCAKMENQKSMRFLLWGKLPKWEYCKFLL